MIDRRDRGRSRPFQRFAQQELDQPPTGSVGSRLTLLVRLQKRSSSDFSRTWFVMRAGRGHGEHVLVHRVTWYLGGFRMRAASTPVAQRRPRGVPSIVHDRREVDTGVWQQRFEAFCDGMAVSLGVATSPPAKDGCSHGLLLPDLGGARVELCWSDEGPAGWRAFASRVRELRDWLDGRFAT